ncbi:Arc family DNA-binding protein [Streptomyces sp. NPDC048179]|uniref:Arc family DNA-binding protein n=1 Tax=Streptomyces sp. NPDC048179 TaxID=3365506 RepID=UPI003716394F
MDEEKRITLRLPADLHERIVERARIDRRSLNSEIVHLLEVAIGPAPQESDSSPA